MLSFSDNRQDSSLQSGHFNDFVATVRLRCALIRALKKQGAIDFGELENAVFEQLGLSIREYANITADSDVMESRIRTIQDAMKSLLKYRLAEDLGNSWRVNLPSLEACGLLRIEYKDWEANLSYNFV